MNVAGRTVFADFPTRRFRYPHEMLHPGTHRQSPVASLWHLLGRRTTIFCPVYQPNYLRSLLVWNKRSECQSLNDFPGGFDTSSTLWRSSHVWNWWRHNRGQESESVEFKVTRGRFHVRSKPTFFGFLRKSDLCACDVLSRWSTVESRLF